VSIPLLLISIYIRLKLQESPVFQRMKTLGQAVQVPISGQLFKYPNNKYVGAGAVRATAGQGVSGTPASLRALLPADST